MTTTHEPGLPDLPQATFFITGEMGKPMIPAYTAEQVREIIAADRKREGGQLGEVVAAKCKEIEESGLYPWKLNGPEHVDVARYQRLRVLGVAPFGSKELTNGQVIRFQSLDAFVDADLDAHPSRGEAAPSPAGLSDEEILAHFTNGNWRDGDGLLTFSAADLCERARALTSRLPPDWVAAEDGMPELGETCFVWSKQPWEKEPSAKIDTWQEQHECPVSFSTQTIPIGPGWDEHDDFHSVTHWKRIVPPIAAAPMPKEG